jgi:N-acetylmuramoyl-L-alanine amidase
MSWLMQGSRGDNVRDVQGLMWQAGLYDGPIDGWYGRKTEAAVKSWQGQVGALPDGAWGAKTIESTSHFLGKLNGPAVLDPNVQPIVPHYGGGQ